MLKTEVLKNNEFSMEICSICQDLTLHQILGKEPKVFNLTHLQCMRCQHNWYKKAELIDKLIKIKN